MKRMTWSLALLAGGITLASLPLWSQVNKSNDGKDLPPAACDLAGTWVGSSPPIPGFTAIPEFGTMNVTETDPSGRQFTAAVHPANVGTIIAFGPFPDADHWSEAVGTYVRSGPRTYQFTWIDYFWASPPSGVTERGQVLYFFTYSGTLEFVDANNAKQSRMISYYSHVDQPPFVHNQDKDNDGLANHGEVPFACVGPWEFTFKRLPVMAPYRP